MSFAAITLCVASQRVFIVVSLSTKSGNIWIHPPTGANGRDRLLHTRHIGS
jgi:hypothetical protein